MNDKWFRYNIGSRLYYMVFLILFVVMNIALFYGISLPDSYINGMFLIMYLVIGYFLGLNCSDSFKNTVTKIKSKIGL